jgi:flavin-dependent dehydrogenase
VLAAARSDAADVLVIERSPRLGAHEHLGNLPYVMAWNSPYPATSI